MTYDCIVLGAGMAGLCAARVLAESGISVLVLEAQERVGGRMLTHHVPGVARPVELGAEFVHGRPPELLALLQEAGLAIVEGEGEQFYFLDGAIRACPEDEGAWALLAHMEEVARDGDMSFEDFLAHTKATEEDKERARHYVEGFNAADARVIGITGLARQQQAEDAIEGDRVARVERGYASLAEYVCERAVAAGATVLRGTIVAQVHWLPGACSVRSVSGRQWAASTVICALPLGVLQNSPTLFAPEPVAAMEAAAKLRAGAVERVVLQFRNAWWAAEYPRMHFLFAQSVTPPTWWTTAPIASPLLTGWAGGPRATPDIAEQALPTLERLFAHSLREELVAVHRHDWQHDPYALGAYSYAPAGAVHAAEVLCEPVEHTLVFAGEHTDITGHPGTVHGAMRSGLRAAGQVLTLLQA